MSAEEKPPAFRPRGRIDEKVHAVSRDAAPAGHRVFRAADGFEAIVAGQVIERAIALGHASEPLEWMGLLVGRVCEDARGRYALVLGMVRDREAVAGRHDVHSTPESEAATRTLARDLFPDCVAIGWIHGHVRHGVFFSPVDRENQRSWRQPHAVGIVVDPWNRELLAVYRGPESERLTPIASSAPQPVAPTTPTRRPSRSFRVRHRRLVTWRRLVLGGLALVAAAAGHAAGHAHALTERIAHLEGTPSRPPSRVVRVGVPLGESPASDTPPELPSGVPAFVPAPSYCTAPPFSRTR